MAQQNNITTSALLREAAMRGETLRQWARIIVSDYRDKLAANIALTGDAVAASSDEVAEETMGFDEW